MLYVLLIEDDEVVQYVHSAMLKKLGCEVEIAESGVKACKLIQKKNNYQIIFTDIGLPDMDGIDIIKTIRALEPPFKDIPIIALTGFVTEKEKENCLQAGANEVITKPLEQSALGELLKKYCY